MIKFKSVEYFIYRSAIFRCISLILLIGVFWGQSTDSLIVDESAYDNGNLKHQRFYNDGKANGKWTLYYYDGNVWIEEKDKSRFMDHLL